MGNFLFWNEVIIPLAGMAVAVILGFPIVRAVVRYVERKGSGVAGVDATLRAEVDDLRVRLERTEETSARLAELEERLDFTERLLTQQRARGELPAGTGRGEGHA